MGGELFKRENVVRAKLVPRCAQGHDGKIMQFNPHPGSAKNVLYRSLKYNDYLDHELCRFHPQIVVVYKVIDKLVISWLIH